jgi:EpsI family protein
MAQRTPNYALVAIMLLLSAAITLWAHTRPPMVVPQVKLSALPASLGDWRQQGADDVIEKGVLEGWIVPAESFLSRSYTDPQGDPVNLMVVYKGQDRRGWHLSEMCYSGSGYNVRQCVVDIPYGKENTKAVQLIAESTADGSKSISVYWFVQGRRTESNFAKQQLAMALSRLDPPKEGWAFIRVTGYVTTSEDATMAQIRDFIRSASDPLLSVLAPDDAAGLKQ